MGKNFEIKHYIHLLSVVILITKNDLQIETQPNLGNGNKILVLHLKSMHVWSLA